MNYGNRVVSVPRAAVDAMARAGETDLKVLLYLSAHESKVDEKKLAKLISCDEADIKASVSFWRGAGLLELCDENENEKSEDISAKEEKNNREEKKTAENSKKLHLPEELPRYSTEELKELVAYGESIGIELVPCIQAMAHFTAFMKNPEFRPMLDCDDILLIGDPPNLRIS